MNNVENLIKKQNLNIAELKELKSRVKLEYRGFEYKEGEYKDWYGGTYEGKTVEVFKIERI